MLNKSYLMIMIGLLSIVVLSVMIYFDMNSPVIHILLAISFVLVGIGILLGFIKMVTDDSEE